MGTRMRRQGFYAVCFLASDITSQAQSHWVQEGTGLEKEALGRTSVNLSLAVTFPVARCSGHQPTEAAWTLWAGVGGWL